MPEITRMYKRIMNDVCIVIRTTNVNKLDILNAFDRTIHDTCGLFLDQRGYAPISVKKRVSQSQSESIHKPRRLDLLGAN